MSPAAWGVLAVAAAGLIAYWNSFTGSFVFDDWIFVFKHASVRAFDQPWNILIGSERPLPALSFALNNALNGMSVGGYHAVNLTIHLLAGIVLFGLARRTLTSPRMPAEYAEAAPGLALAVALIWTVHPLLTQSVTYIVQRAESMMGLFYLLTLYCALRASASLSHRRGWSAAAIAACGLGMGCKPIMLTAPLMTLLHDRIFVSGSVREALRGRWRLYLGLAATWGILAALAVFIKPEGDEMSAGLALQSVTPLTYAGTQLGVVLHYLRLALWPAGLVLDYAWPVASTLGAIAAPGVVIGALFLATGWALRYRPPAGFLGAWFFVILAPSSSFYPIADLAVEHRMYLPLAAVVALAVIGGWRVLRRAVADPALRRGAAVCLVIALVAVLTAVTIKRNEVYQSEIAMWADVVAKRPDNPRGRNSYGAALAERGRNAEAIPHYRAALRLDPELVSAHSNLGAALVNQGKLAEAVQEFQEAIRLDPDEPGGHNNLGVVYTRQGFHLQAAESYAEAVRLKPDFTLALHNLGVAQVSLGRLRDAIANFELALRLDPTLPGAREKLNQAKARLASPPTP